MQNFNAVAKLAKNYSEKLKKQKNIISIVQVGSSLRKEDFKANSDLDFLVVYENSVKKFMKFYEANDIEINVLRRGKKQLIKLLEKGNPVDLVALRFGKVLYDRGFFRILRKRNFKPTAKTIEKWVHTATFNLGDAAMNYSLPACMCCYFKALHHAAREFCRVIILEVYEKLVEGDMVILKILKTTYPDLYQKFRLIINGRKNYEKFKERCIEEPKIKNSELGKYLLVAEDIAIKALKISLNLNVPKVNKLVSQLQKKYKIDHYHSFHIVPERKELIMHLILKEDKSGFFRYNLENGKLEEVDVK